MHIINRAPFTPMIVRTHGVESIIKAVQIESDKTGRRYLADRVTGTIYDPETGRCVSSSARQIVGPVPEGYTPPKRAVSSFSYGTQPIAKRKRGRPVGGGVGPERARLSEDDERQIRAKKAGSTCCYVLTNKQCQERFGVSKSCVDNVRRSPLGRVAK